jgi:hypothetical protein
MSWAGHVALMQNMRNAYKILASKPEKNICRRMWENNIKIDLKETEWDGVDWIHVVHDMDQWRDFLIKIMNLWVSSRLAELSNY